ncbi:MAG: hypothetical protein H0X63_00690 [Flavobacteriales bacterium]|jgi:hypothetical protein|nr:hypothetical protein [Flavobacteriales bacterium]
MRKHFDALIQVILLILKQCIMKIDLKSSQNKNQLQNVRSQIQNSEDLRKFDTFLSENTSFDFENSEDVAAARKCCGGDNCCQNITIEFKLHA